MLTLVTFPIVGVKTSLAQHLASSRLGPRLSPDPDRLPRR